MDPISGIVAAKAIQEVTDVVSDALGSDESTKASGFESFMRQVLVPSDGNNINEEELFAAVLQQRISALKGDAVGERFAELFKEEKDATRRKDGYEFVEDSANSALSSLASEGLISDSEADSLRAEAFTAAQLDNNLNALYDGRGGGSDRTVATMDMDSALAAAQLALDRLASGEIESTSPSEDSDLSSLSSDSEQITPDGNSVDGNEGFLFKPESERDGKLVVLLPAQIAGEIESIILKDSNNRVLEEGQFSSNSNGGRDTYRFAKTGAAYPENLTVEVRLQDGTLMTYEIPNPSERYD